MALIDSNGKIPKLKLDLSGPDGNAYVLLGTASALGKSLGLDKERLSEILDEMRSSDYKNLILTLDKYFGDHVDLILPASMSAAQMREEEDDTFFSSNNTSEDVSQKIDTSKALGCKPKAF